MFDPTESGNFTGAVQVGIQDGQGSVSSPPLVGIAHKIEVSPGLLNFGTVIVGSTKEQTLTVKNQGVTAVTLETPNTTLNSPFSITLPENPVTLGPGKSVEATVRFTATTSGVFSRNVSLISGSLSIEIPTVARAMTREEYLRLAVAAYNAAVQQGDYAALYVQDNNRGLALAGFPALSEDDVTGFMGMFDQLASPETGEIPPEVAQAIQILNTIGEQQIEAWLWALVLAERAGLFEQEYARLLPLGFDNVVQAFQLINSMTPEQIRAYLQQSARRLAATDANDLRSALRTVLEATLEPISVHIRRILERYYSSIPGLFWQLLFGLCQEVSVNSSPQDQGYLSQHRLLLRPL